MFTRRRRGLLIDLVREPQWRRGDLCWVQVSSVIGPPVVCPAVVMDVKEDSCLVRVDMPKGGTHLSIYSAFHPWRRYPNDELPFKSS